MQKALSHTRLIKAALRHHRAGSLQVNKIMEKLGKEMEDFLLLNNNRRDSQKQILPDILYHLFPPNGI